MMNKFLMATAAAALIAGPALAGERVTHSSEPMILAQAAQVPAVPQTAVGVEQRRDQGVDDQPAPNTPLVPPGGMTGTPAAPVAEGTAVPAAPQTAAGVEERRDALVDDQPAPSPTAQTEPAAGATTAEPLATGTIGTTGTVDASGDVRRDAPAVPGTAIGVQERRAPNVGDSPAR